MNQTYRVRYSPIQAREFRNAGDVVTMDIEADLDHIPDFLPPSAYIMYVEDLTAGQNIHWTRWPVSFRP